MTNADAFDDALAGWDPQRRVALGRLWEVFASAKGSRASLSDDLVAERRAEAEAEDHQASSE